MMKKFFIQILIAIVLVCSTIIINNSIFKANEKKNQKIELRQASLSVDNKKGIVSWKRVPNADGYKVYLDNNLYEDIILYKDVTNNSIFIDIEYYSTSHIIQVEAYSNNDKYISSLSQPVLYTVPDKIISYLSTSNFNTEGIIKGYTEIDIFNKAYFNLRFSLSSHYKIRINYANTSDYITTLNIIKLFNNQDIEYEKLDDGWFKVYIDSDSDYSFELENLNYNHSLVDFVCVPMYETSVFDEYKIKLEPGKNEIIKVTYDEAEELVYRFKKFNKKVKITAHFAFGIASNIGNNLEDQLVMISKNTLANLNQDAIYLYIENLNATDVINEITIEKVNIDEKVVNFDETITIDSLDKVNIFKIKNPGNNTQLYLEYFDKNIAWKKFVTSSFTSILAYQTIKGGMDSSLFNINNLSVNQDFYFIIVPDSDSYNQSDSFVVSQIKPIGWS